jgi:hypothetical protein
MKIVMIRLIGKSLDRLALNLLKPSLQEIRLFNELKLMKESSIRKPLSLFSKKKLTKVMI